MEIQITVKTIAWLDRKRKLEEKMPIKIRTFNPQVITTPNGTTCKTPISVQLVISELNKQILEVNKMDDFIFSTGVGIHQMVAAQLITWTQPRTMLTSGSMGTMGVSLGFCIGAKLANKDKTCVSIDGDGSFNMTLNELKTVTEEKIPIKIMIVDNER